MTGINGYPFIWDRGGGRRRKKGDALSSRSKKVDGKIDCGTDCLVRAWLSVQLDSRQSGRRAMRYADGQYRMHFFASRIQRVRRQGMGVGGGGGGCGGWLVATMP